MARMRSERSIGVSVRLTGSGDRRPLGGQDRHWKLSTMPAGMKRVRDA